MERYFGSKANKTLLDSMYGIRGKGIRQSFEFLDQATGWMVMPLIETSKTRGQA